MSAIVSQSGYQWYCDDCCEGEGGFDTESAADAAADRHDDLNAHEATS